MNQQLPARQGNSYKDVSIAQRGGGGMLLPQTFGDVVSFSEIMARAQHAIPRHLRDVPGACLAVTMQAMRWEMDPFAVASKSYNVKDIIAYEAQLIAAVVHTRAPLKTRPNYTYSGEGQDRRCTVSAVFDDGIERSYESPRIGDITTKNSPLWKSDPDQQLGYFSVRSFARRYCPEVILGVYTPEEAETFRGPDNARDVTPRPSLADRLAAAPQAATDGFSQEHVISEIDGAGVPETSAADAHRQPDRMENMAGPSDGGDHVTASTRPDHAGANPGAETGQAGERPAPVSNSSQPPPQVDAETDKPASDPNPSAPDAGTNSESSRSSLTDDGVQAGAGPDKPGAGLPPSWEVTYIAALKRARKKESLPKYAQAYWDQYGGWAGFKDTPDGEVGAAIYDAFRDHFDDEAGREAVLREVVGGAA